MEFLRRTWAEIDLDNLCFNYQSIKKSLSQGSQIMAVVKADAYGHGDRVVSRELQRQGVKWFGVSNIEEALCLRDAGITGEILILGPTPVEYLTQLCENNITQTVHTMEYGKELSAAALAMNTKVKCHFKLDTGMHRIGFDCRDQNVIDNLEQLYQDKGLQATGIFTHFASADELSEDGRQYTFAQFNSFCEVCGKLVGRGIAVGIRHCCNSAATILYPQMHLDMVRCGIVLYGLDPSVECKGKAELKPVMELYSAVTMVKEIRKGDMISYGRIYTAAENRKIATVAIGYADGYNRNLSGTGRMIVNGQYANVVGRVCMDQLLLDVTHIPDIKVGDTATIVGSQNGISLSFDEMAEKSGTINYEKTCLIGRRVTRVYRKYGELYEVMSYLRKEEHGI